MKTNKRSAATKATLSAPPTLNARQRAEQMPPLKPGLVVTVSLDVLCHYMQLRGYHAVGWRGDLLVVKPAPMDAVPSDVVAPSNEEVLV